MYTIEQHKIDDEIISSLESILDCCVEFNEKLIPLNSTYTKDGIQTENLCGYKNVDEVITKILININHTELTCKHLHMISYNEGGMQEVHGHAKTETHSFVLYLSTCEDGGETVFIDETGNEVSVPPKRGSLLLFDSRILHYGKPTKSKKKVVVAALI